MEPSGEGDIAEKGEMGREGRGTLSPWTHLLVLDTFPDLGGQRVGVLGQGKGNQPGRPQPGDMGNTPQGSFKPRNKKRRLKDEAREKFGVGGMLRSTRGKITRRPDPNEDMKGSEPGPASMTG